jgi:hypothetical protein
MKAIYQASSEGIHLKVYVQPGASTSAFQGVYNERLKFRVAARAVDGAANKSLCQLLSQVFNVSKSCVTLVSGEKSREKQVFIAGDPKSLSQRAAALIAGAPPT